MDPTSDELNQPLGVAIKGATETGPWLSFLRIGVIGAAASIVAVVAGAAILGSSEGGRPVVHSDITFRKAAPPVEEPAPVVSGDPTRRDAKSLESETGISVVRPDGSAPPKSIVIRIPDEKPKAAPADPRLIEQSRSGPLPRIGADGTRPVDAYARPAGELPGGARPAGRIAIVVGGLGISRTATEAALEDLPDAITLAFAPYGDSLDSFAQRARAGGRELLLQVPMEPFDYPDSDPGPHTLKAAAKARENIDHLQWAMGRFTGYVGIMNYMGAKLTSDERALTPIMRELAQRGLGFVDDGSSSRSLITSLGGDVKSARADTVLDAVPRAETIDKLLEKLETQATSTSRIVVASASALPITVDRLSRWAKGLEAKGILLVPVSAALGPGRQRQSER